MVLQVMVMVVFYDLLIHYSVVVFVDVVTGQVLVCLVVGCLILIVYEDVLLDVANLGVVVDGVVFIMHVVLGCVLHLLGYVEEGSILMYIPFINIDHLFLVEGIS